MITFKVVLNKCYGGFNLSEKACKRLEELTGKKVVPSDYSGEEKRTDTFLIQVVKEMGEEASGEGANLQVVIVGISTMIDYDGKEYLGFAMVEMDEKEK